MTEPKLYKVLVTPTTGGTIEVEVQAESDLDALNEAFQSEELPINHGTKLVVPSDDDPSVVVVGWAQGDDDELVLVTP